MEKRYPWMLTQKRCQEQDRIRKLMSYEKAPVGGDDCENCGYGPLKRAARKRCPACLVPF